MTTSAVMRSSSRSSVARALRDAIPSAGEASLVVGSALLTVLTFPDFKLWFLAWISLAPLLVVIARTQSALRAFVAGWRLGSQLLLRHLLVADLSDDSLRRHQRILGVSAFNSPRNSRRALPCSLCRLARARGSTVRRLCASSRSADLGFDGVTALCGDRSVMERARLLASISSMDDSNRALGRCLCDQLHVGAGQLGDRYAAGPASSATAATLRRHN